MAYKRFMRVKFLANIVQITILAFLISSCCLFSPKSANTIIRIDTLRITKVDSVKFEGKAQIQVIKDTVILIKPYLAKIDTIISRYYQNRIVYDTIKVQYNTLDSNFNLEIKHERDSLVKITQEKIQTLIKEKSFFEKIKENLLFIIFSFILGLIIALFLKLRG